MTYGLDPKGSKYRPTWKKGIWLGKDGSDHDVLATAAGTITRTRSIRRTALRWSADEILSLVIGQWDTTGYTQSKVKQVWIYHRDHSLMKKQKQSKDFKIQMTNVNKLNKKFNPMHMSPQHPMEKVLDLKMSQNEMMVEFLFLLFLL